VCCMFVYSSVREVGENMSIAYHGNNCGPGWSAGKWQTSTLEAKGTAVDEFDLTCEKHDLQYARGEDLAEADIQFALENLKVFDPKRNLAGLIVGLQGLGRKTFENFLGMAKKKTSVKQVAELAKKMIKKGRRARKRNAVMSSTEIQAMPVVPSIGGSSGPSVSFAPAAVSRRVAMSKPSYKYRNGRVVISHSEFIDTVISNGDGGFHITRYQINPGLASTFNWLSNVAGQYDRYRWIRLTFYYVPAASSTEKGRLSMAYSKDPTQAFPATGSQMFQIVPNEETNLWSPAELTSFGSKEMFVRTFGTNQLAQSTFVTDLKTTDDGTLFVATNLADTSTTVGEIYCYYEVELYNPVYDQFSDRGQIANSGTNIRANVFANTASLSVANQLIVPSTSSNTFIFNLPGTYWISSTITGTGITTSALDFAVINAGATVNVISSQSALKGDSTKLIVNLLVAVIGDSITETCVCIYSNLATGPTTVTYYSFTAVLVTNSGITNV